MSAELKENPAEKVDYVTIEIDGQTMQAPKGSMIIEAADKAGIDIPRFCYHKNLSIAANCRMCLVDVEKAPKPLPACATPVNDGMKVYTDSRRAVDAQHGVMEFLLINHPLDCPICDQGGECELQDLAMGYGRSVSRFTERKRVVKDKNVGPLIQTDMTRCIHCTRCVRFLDEVAGTTEMGGVGRGDRTEISTCIEGSIESELSGNIIDLCPVGALTNKPFRFSARAWELMAKPSIAAHDGLGSNLYYHTRRSKLMRAVPRDNDDINDTWLSDRDRYSHFGLYAQDRVTQPEVKKNGQWKTVSWDEATQAAAKALKDGVAAHGGEHLGVLMSGSATNEEYFLGQRMTRALGSENIDHRLLEQDFSDDGQRTIPVFSSAVANLHQADSILLIGSNIRHELPIVGQKVRKASLQGAKVSVVNPISWNFHFDLDQEVLVAPQDLVQQVAALAQCVHKDSGVELPSSIADKINAAECDEATKAIAAQLKEADQSVIFLGQYASSHYQAAWLRQLAAYIAKASDSALNLIPFGGNPVGAWSMGAVPANGGQTSAEMLDAHLKVCLLWDFEPDFDTANPSAAKTALSGVDQVVAVTSFASDALRTIADVILPLAPWAESEGSMTNLDGIQQAIEPAVAAMGEAKPGWKILRRLGEEMGLEGFDQVSLADVQEEMSGASFDRAAGDSDLQLVAEDADQSLYRIGELPMYGVDATCRRSAPLQQSVHSDSHFVGLNEADAHRLGLTDGGKARVSQSGAFVELPVKVLSEVPAGGAWVRAASCSASKLANISAPISVEVA